MGRIVTFEKARSGPIIAWCYSNRPSRRRIYVLRHCTETFELGHELVDLSADSLLIRRGREHTRIAHKALGYWRRGTELTMTAIGH